MFISILAVAASGCAVYAPRPLDPNPVLAVNVAALRLPADRSIDPASPLTADAVAVLAVLNNPDLIAARQDRGIAEAQLLQAGLLPNPQLGASYGFLRAGPGISNQWSVGLSEDIRALVTFSTVRRTAELGVAQTKADILWQEWQVVGKARMLFVDAVKLEQVLGLLNDAHALLTDRYARDRRAVDEGNLTLAAIAPDLASLADIDRQLADAELKDQTGRRDLDLLLGLEPSVRLALSTRLDIPVLDPTAARRAMAELPSRRPDLVALRLGYGAQEEKLRAAILGQFPAMILGGSGGHDTSRIYSIGPTITMDLPIFNQNQGAIATETATREKLHIEYGARVTAARAEINGILADQALLARQLDTARKAADEADRTAAASRNAYLSTLIDARSNADLVVAALTRRQEVSGIEQTLLEQQIALATLTGMGIPVTDGLPADAGAIDAAVEQ